MIGVRNIRKAFPGTLALDDVSLEVKPGTVHALLGANGSGKSTLVKILTGVYQPDAGTILINGRELDAIASPNEAGAIGVAALHQEAPVVDSLSVVECVALFRGYPTTAGRVRWRALRQETDELLARFGLKIDSEALAGRLSQAERALLGLAIVLDQVRDGIGLLVLDEVTASLPESQAETFLERVDQLAADGTPVLMVTHRLEEVGAHAGEVTVLREGRIVYHGPAGAETPEAMIGHIVGHAPGGDVGDPSPPASVSSGRVAPRAPSAAALEVKGLSGEIVDDAAFVLHPGEIVGVGGRAEGGVIELPLLLSGAKRRRSGEIAVAGHRMSQRAGPRDFIKAGLAMLPGDRLRSGGVASLSVRENVVLPAFGRYWHRRGSEQAALDEVIKRFDVRPPSPDVLFGSLSGGNQQKVLMGKWLLLDPAVMILDDPTSGVDPGARQKMFSVLRTAAKSGLAVLLFSSELEQLVGMCSRVLVLRRGAVARELRDGDLNLQTVTEWCNA